MKIRLATPRPMLDPCACASGYRTVSRSAGFIHFPSRSMMRLPSERAPLRDPVVRDLAPAVPLPVEEAARLAAEPHPWLKMPWTCPRNAGSRALIRRKGLPQIICGNYLLDMTDAGLPAIPLRAQFLATG